MATKYTYTIERDNIYGDSFIGWIHWSVNFDHDDWGSRQGGYAHTKASALRKIRRAVKKYDRQTTKRFKIDGKI